MTYGGGAGFHQANPHTDITSITSRTVVLVQMSDQH
jgi:hypothetical protein